MTGSGANSRVVRALFGKARSAAYGNAGQDQAPGRRWLRPLRDGCVERFAALPASLRSYRPAPDPAGRNAGGAVRWLLRGCGRRYRAEAPVGMQPGTPVGPGIRSLLAYLHHSHHVGFERLSRLAVEMFGPIISEGAIANIFRRMGQDIATATRAIDEKLRSARIIASDETTTRTKG